MSRRLDPMASKIPLNLEHPVFQRFCEMLALTHLVIFLHPGKAKPHPLCGLAEGTHVVMVTRLSGHCP